MPRKSGGLLISGGQNHQLYRLVLILVSVLRRTQEEASRPFSLISLSCSVDSGEELMKRLI